MKNWGCVISKIKRNPFLLKCFMWVGAILITGFFSLDVSIGRFAMFSSAGKEGFLLYTVACIGVYFCLKAVKKKTYHKTGKAQTAIQIILSVFFAGFSILGIAFDSKKVNSILNIFLSPTSFLFTLLGFVGGTLAFFIFFRIIYCLPSLLYKTKNFENRWLSSFFGKHLYRNCILLGALCWLPQYILRFPGILYYDTWRLLAMYFEYPDLAANASVRMTNIHPLIWTIPVGKLTELGMRINIPWFGFATISFIQHVVALYLIAYVTSSFKKFGLPSILLASVMGFYIFLPPMSFYASTIQNDYFYSLSAMLLTIELVYYLYRRGEYFKSVRHIGLTMLGVFGFNLRYNGFYTILVCFFFIVLREIWLLIKNKTKFRNTVILFLTITIALSSGQLIQNTLDRTYSVEVLTSRVKYALPIQQIARCIAVHGDKIPQDIRDDIHVVLMWSDDEIAENYNPLNFDGVKLCFKNDATKQELRSFVRAWLRLIVLYPADCIMATVHQNHYLFNPLSHNFRCYKYSLESMHLISERYQINPQDFIPQNKILTSLCRYLSSICNTEIASAPFWGILANQAIHTMLLFALFFYNLLHKDKKQLILTIIPLVTLGITILGPAVYLHPRYTYPIMFSMPILLVAFMNSNRSGTNGNMELLE